jgi:Uma2 family endonuclease
MQTAVRPRLFTVDEYYAMGEAGVFAPHERVELLEGRIVAMAPIGPLHASAVDRLAALFAATFGGRAIVRGQNPVRLSAHSEPQPDIALLRPRDDFYARRHPGPADVFALIEVAVGSLAYDRGRKLRAYARRGIAEYWIVDLAKRRIESYRAPSAFAYEQQHFADGAGETLAFEAFPADALTVAALLGPALSG